MKTSRVFIETIIMKRLLTILAVIAFGVNQHSNAQITDYSVYGDSLTGCQNTMYIYWVCGANAEVGGYVEVNWGDGNTDTYPADTDPNTNGDELLAHTYAVPGQYTANIQVYSGTNAAYVDAGTDRVLTAYSANACAFFGAYAYQSSPYLGYWDVPMDCEGADGTVTTITPSQLYGYYIGLDPANAPYTVSINDNWLTTNGYTQVTADQTINSFDANGQADNTQMSFEITCSVAAANPDFSVVFIWPSNFVAPLQTGSLHVYICNNACANTSDMTVSLNFPAGFTPVTTNLTNPVINGNNLTFDVADVTNCISMVIPFTFPGTTQAGTPICFDLTAINPNDTDLSNNTDSACSVVLNSYDPNDKQVNLPEQISPADQETLEYMIRFQNDGNYSAVNVTVVDTISENLDLSTFRVLGTKHGVATHLDEDTRIVTFTFSGIGLAPSSQDLDASQGYIVYEIKEVAGLQEGDEIENTAYIYFDFNPAIVTNTTHNINSSLGNQEMATETLVVYPNPAQNTISILGGKVNSVSIVDMTGKTVLTQTIGTSNVVNIEGLSNGIYTVLMTSDNGVAQQRLVVKK